MSLISTLLYVINNHLDGGNQPFTLWSWTVLSCYSPVVSENHNEEGMEQALLYAIGALEVAEVAAFEKHLQEGCRSCQDELRDFQGVAAGLALTAPQHSPDDNVRRRLMALFGGGPGLTT